MRTTFTILLIFLVTTSILSAQDCGKLIESQKTDGGYVINSQSKSLPVMTGKTYSFVINLNKGIDYRLKFFADSKFNKNIKFKLTDKISRKVIFDLPGKSKTNKKGTSALTPYPDNKVLIHPYFDIRPVGSTVLELTVTVQSNSTFPGGCIAILLMNKPKGI